MFTRCIKGNIVKQVFYYRMQPSCSDVLTRFIGIEGRLRDGVFSIIRKAEMDVIRFKQGLILLCDSILRLCQYALIIGNIQRIQLNADGESSLQLRY